MKDRIFKSLLAAVFLFCFHITDVMTVFANEESLVNIPRQLLNEDIRDNPEEDIPDLQGGSENPEQARQQPVDLRILQQRYPDIFFLQDPTDQKRIALTFDDGPDPRFANDVLDVLDLNIPFKK